MIRVTTGAFALAALAMLPAGVAAQAPSLKNPASLKEQAPATYKVKFDTSIGVFVIQVNREFGSTRGGDLADLLDILIRPFRLLRRGA